jgi:hypothetical protein
MAVKETAALGVDAPTVAASNPDNATVALLPATTMVEVLLNVYVPAALSKDAWTAVVPL